MAEWIQVYRQFLPTASIEEILTDWKKFTEYRTRAQEFNEQLNGNGE